MYIGGSDTLPPPLPRDEEAALLARLDGGELSVPNTSLSSSSLPSQSVFSGSSKLTSTRLPLFFRRYIRISFSMQREA